MIDVERVRVDIRRLTLGDLSDIERIESLVPVASMATFDVIDVPIKYPAELEAGEAREDHERADDLNDLVHRATMAGPGAGSPHETREAGHMGPQLGFRGTQSSSNSASPEPES